MKYPVLIATFLIVALAEMRAMTIKIDFGDLSDAPIESYGGGGSIAPGTWNVYDGMDTSNLAGLVDIEGNSSPIEISLLSGSLFAVTAGAEPFSGNHGPLLGDYIVGGANTFTMRMTNIPIGDYRLRVFTVGRQDFPAPSTLTLTGTTVNENGVVRNVTGIWAGGLQRNVTHGGFSLSVEDPSNDFFLEVFSPSDAFINGLRLWQIPEPGLPILLGIGILFSLIRRRRC